MASKDKEKHLRECAEAILSQQGGYRRCKPFGARANRSTSHLVAELVQRQDQRLRYIPSQHRKDVRRRVLGRMQRKLEELGRPGLCKAKGSDKNVTADTHVMRADIFIQCRLLQYRRNSQKVKDLVGIQWADTRSQL